MMSLKNVKDWLKTQVCADVWRIGGYDTQKEKTICVRSLPSDRSVLPIGGVSNIVVADKGVSILIHWNKNLDETECKAQEVYALFFGSSPIIDGFQTVKCDIRSDEPILLGTDENGIFEYVVEIWITYMRDRKE